MADIPLTPRPQIRRSAQAPQVEVVARQNSYGGIPQGDGGELDGLVRGLSALNPALGRLAQAQDQQGLQDAAAAGKAAAQVQEAPVEALTGAPIELPNTVPAAYSRTFREAFAESLAQRVGVQNKLEAFREFGDKRLEEGFDAASWLQERRAAALKGITDPRAQAIVGAHFTELEAQIAGEAERDRLIRRDEARASTATQLAADMFTADLDGERIHQNYPVFLQRAKELGYSPKESAQFLFTQLVHASNKLGGSPEVFDAFDIKDAEGLTLRARNPQLSQAIDQARSQAVAQRDKQMLESAEKDNAKILMGYESDIDRAPEKVTMERIVADMTPYGAIRSPEQAASMWARAQAAMEKRMATQSFMADAQAGRLWIHDPKVQHQVLDQLSEPLVQGLAQATSANQPGAIAQIGAGIVQLHSSTGATEPVQQLQRYVKTLVSNLPSKDGPTPQFLAAAELYKALSANPQYREMYFKDDTAAILESFSAETNMGTDAGAAYKAAYQSVSPEAKAAAEAFTKTPEFQTKLKGSLQKYVEGSSWVPRWIGGNGRPENTPYLKAEVSSAVRSFVSRNPFATDEQVDSYVEQWTKQHFVFDTASQSVVKVPPGRGGQATQEALSEYSAKLAKEFKLASRSDSDWKVQYVPLGTEGVYSVVLFNGTASQPAGTVRLDTLLTNHRAAKTLSDEERLALSGLRKGLASGNIPQVDQQLVAKATALGVLNPAEVQTLKARTMQQFQERLQSVPQVTFGKPSFENLQHIPGRPKVDTGLTARIAKELATGAMTGPDGHHQSYAASLIAMGEGVMLRAYDDPARGAGRNIGMGYNLKANAKTVNEDLKRAGVPEEQIEEVKAGQRELTPSQAKRLLLTAMPRYEKQVQSLAEATQPGLWGRMTPAQKAVMIDVAYQTGDAGQFKKAWDALARGDQQAFAEQTKVTYVDSSGERRVDTRRNNLRAALLSGISVWDSAVQKYGSLPSSKLQAVALTTN